MWLLHLSVLALLAPLLSQGQGQAGGAGAQRPEVPQRPLYSTRMFRVAAHYPPVIGTGFVAILGLEFAQGEDLNGDGDMADRAVLSVFDSARGTVVDTGLSIESSYFGLDPTLALGDRLLVFTVEEEGQGHGSLNGDGDADDAVAFYHDVASGSTVALGAIGLGVDAEAIRAYRVHGRRIIYQLSEANQGDVNGDGDSDDRVTLLLDVDAGETTMVSDECDWPPIGLTGRFAYLTRAEWCGIDLNGDGDTLDRFLSLYDTQTGRTTEFPVGWLHLAETPGTTSEMVIFAKAEDDSDLNGDGDLTDHVVQVVDLRTLALTNTGLATASTDGWLPGWEFRYRLHQHLDAERFVFNVDEAAQGADLNGDGDLQDGVTHLYDHRLAEPPLNLQLATDVMRAVLIEDRVVLAVSEFYEGRDLDGDGLLNHAVVHVVWPGQGPAWNTGSAVDTSFSRLWPYWFRPMEVDGDFLGFQGPELGPLNAVDLPGGTLSALEPFDGRWARAGVLFASAARLPENQNRRLLYVTDPRTGTRVDTRIPVYDFSVHPTAPGRRAVAMLVSEADWDGGPRDLNGDGDTDDHIPALLRQER